MASDIDKGNFGDSSRNRSKCDLSSKKSNHVFDGAGENIQHYSDTESLGSRKSKTRYINPAIFIESVESTHSETSLQTDSSCIDDVTPHPHSSYRSNSTPFLTGRVSSNSSGSIKRKSCRLTNQNGCYVNDETPRDGRSIEDRTYREDGPDTFRLSVASLSTTTTAKEERDRNEKKKHEAFQQWLARKEQEKRDKARHEKMKLQVVPITQEQREESFTKWLERKRMQDERRKADEIMKRYNTTERMEQERKKRQQEKEEKLAEWIKKKEEDMKLLKTKSERLAASRSIEEQRRRIQGERAYRDWLRTSKNKPLPVPLNQGVLSMRGSVSQMFINPIPWQSPT